MTPDDIARHFTRADGRYHFARWGRPIVPVVFGVEDATLSVLKGAIEAVASLARHPMAETDPELGVNLMLFFIRDWAELPKVPKLDRLIPDLSGLCDRLQAKNANQYRMMRFDASGAIKAAFVFLRMDAALSDLPVETVALYEAVKVILDWGDDAFADASPLAQTPAGAVLRPEVARLIRASYDPILPAVAQDMAHAYRLAARI